MKAEFLIAVNEQDEQVGEVEKMEAHQQGILHRAFSVFIFNSKGEWILQQRAFEKYHSGGLWTNTCCSHPHPGEETADAAANRLEEEMGLICPLYHIFNFIYKTPFSNGLTEYELDHVFFGITDELPVINPAEANAYKIVTYDEIKAQTNAFPDDYTVWFQLLFERVYGHLKVNQLLK